MEKNFGERETKEIGEQIDQSRLTGSWFADQRSKQRPISTQKLHNPYKYIFC